MIFSGGLLQHRHTHQLGAEVTDFHLLFISLLLPHRCIQSRSPREHTAIATLSRTLDRCLHKSLRKEWGMSFYGTKVYNDDVDIWPSVDGFYFLFFAPMSNDFVLNARRNLLRSLHMICTIGKMSAHKQIVLSIRSELYCSKLWQTINMLPLKAILVY